jgi:hypothetical protein
VTPTEQDGVLFYEDCPAELVKGAEISTTIDGVFRNAQAASLRDVKSQLATECKSRGANTVVGFRYGQKSSGFFASLLSRDNVYWYGSGYIANSPKE